MVVYEFASNAALKEETPSLSVPKTPLTVVQELAAKPTIKCSVAQLSCCILSFLTRGY